MPAPADNVPAPADVVVGQVEEMKGTINIPNGFLKPDCTRTLNEPPLAVILLKLLDITFS